MYILADLLNAVLDFNLQFFIDLILNNFLWLIIFGFAGLVFYPKKGLILGTILIALTVYFFIDVVTFFNVPSLFDAIPLTWSLIGITLLVLMEGTVLEKYDMFVWLILVVFIGWLLV